jgi:hypothetical protein
MRTPSPQHEGRLVGEKVCPGRIFIAHGLIERHLATSRSDFSNDQIDQGDSINVVAKSAVVKNVPAVLSNEIRITGLARRAMIKSNSIAFRLGKSHRITCPSFSGYLLTNIVDIPERR